MRENKCTTQGIHRQRSACMCACVLSVSACEIGKTKDPIPSARNGHTKIANIQSKEQRACVSRLCVCVCVCFWPRQEEIVCQKEENTKISIYSIQVDFFFCTQVNVNKRKEKCKAKV